MNLESPFVSHLRRFRNIYLIVGLGIFLVVFFSLVYRGCDNWQFWRGIEGEKSNFNQAMNEANKIEQTIDNLNRQAIEQGAEVNQKKKEHNRAMEESDNQQVIINAQRELINALEREKEINVSLEEFNRNRCLALPNANGCR